ncbi:MAG: Chemotaxis protein methyltransferase CheR [Myxococcaceae bacterium]|nr:Chemotaxis protein methyltransferase CheR [Myxococcaceae bacterium]
MSLRAKGPGPNELSVAGWQRHIDSIDEFAITLLGPKGDVTGWSRGAEALHGYRSTQIIGQHVGVLYAPEGPLGDAPTRDLEAAGRVGRAERRGWRLRRDGSQFFGNVVITAARDDAGELQGFTVVTRDSAPGASTTAELDGPEERFRLLMEAVSDYAIYMLDPHGNVTTWNTGAAQIKGYSAHEIIGKPYSIFFTEEEVQSGKPQHELARALKCGRFEEEGWRVRKDGSRFWASVVLTPVKNSHGELLGFAKVTHDLTARKQAEETAQRLAGERAAREAAEAAEARVRENEARLRGLSTRLEIILEGLADGVAAQTREGRLIFANRAGALAMGFPSVEACLAATVQERATRFELLDEHGAPVDVRQLPGQRVLRGEPACSMIIHVRDRDTGEEWWRQLRATGVMGQDGLPELAIYIWHDITEERRREKHDSYLAQATAALAESLDYGSTLATLARLLVPGIGDWCSIHLLEKEQLEQVAVTHVDPEKVKYAREYGRRYPPDPKQSQGVWNVLRTGLSELYAEIPEPLLAESARDDEHLAFLRAAGMRSVLIVPIRTQERVLGTLSLVSSESGRRYGQPDLRLAEELGRRSGTAIENARLYAAQKKARGELALLARAGEAFSSATSYDEMLDNLVSLALPALGDFVIVELIERDAVRTLAAVHDDPQLDAALKSLPWSADAREKPDASVHRSEQTEFIPAVDELRLRDVAPSEAHLEVLRRLELGSLVKVPLRSRQSVLGALTICFGKSRRRYTDEDVSLIEELARRTAVSLAQAQLYASARHAAKSAEEANRLKDEFLATVSHELRTPLNAILGWASLLRARTQEPSLAKPIEIIHRNAIAQGKIIEDILDTSRIITGTLRLDLAPTDLARTVRETIDILRPSISAKNLGVELVHAVPECVLVADADRLQQVVWNLLSNAVKFSDLGGRIVVSLERVDAGWLVTVQDGGRGIAPEFLPFVFERFTQADGSTTRRVGGLGLGLAIVRHLVELHGGHVEAASAGLGQGATFRVLLPVQAATYVPGDVESGAPRAQSETPVSGGDLTGKRVVVVDDEEDARNLLVTALSEAGAVVRAAASAAEGIEAVRQFQPHVLVSDIGMPEEDGLSLIRRVRRLRGESGGVTPAIALTAYTREIDREQALEAGFTAYLAKPVRTDELVALIAQLLGLGG